MNVILFFTLIFIAATAMPSYQTAPTDDIKVSTKEEVAKIYACEDKDGPTKPIVTKGTAAVHAAVDVLSVGSRNINAAKAMDAAMAVLCDPKASNTARTAAVKDMESIQEYLRHSGNALIAAAKHSAPIAGLKKAHEEEERKKLSDAKATINAGVKKKKKNPSKKLPEVLLLEDYVKQKKGEATSLMQAQVVSPEDQRVTRSRTSTTKSTTSTYDKSQLPKPQNGTSYTKPEVVSVIESALQDTSQGNTPVQAHIIKAIISAGYVPVHQRNVEKLMQKRRKGDAILDTPWTQGRAKAVPDDIVAKTAESIRNGTSEGPDMQGTVEKMITDLRAERQEKAGLVPNPKTPSHSTVDKYVVKLVQQGASIVDNTVSKTETRNTNEKSERGPISNVALVGATQFEVMDEEDRELNRQLANASFQTRALYELVRRARGGAPIWAIRPQLLFSTDDTTTYIFDGKEGKQGKWVFASERAIKNRGTQSIYREEKVNMMNGIRVKVTFTFSGAGMTAPLFITVSGLSEEEMPNDEFLHVQVPGLAVGGEGVTVGSKTMGHVFFMRKGKGADEERVKYYQDEILLPWIEEVRKGIDSNYVTGMKVPTKLKAVSWMDGALDQVASIADNPEKFAKAWITVCKQNPGRTAVEQPADLAPVFKLFKQYVANTSSLDQHVTNLFRDKLDKAFKTDEDLAGLKLKTNHHNALIDFLAICASAATKACTLKNVIKGWTESGLLDGDERGYRFPVLAKILATCKKAEGIKASLVDKVSDDFVSLLNQVDKYGRISEEWFDKNEYPRDQNKNGEDVLRNDSSRQEHLQRSKVMTHAYQVKARLEVIEAKIEKQRSKLVKENEEHEALIASDKSTVDQLCSLAGRPASEENLVYCTLEMFAHKSIPSPNLFNFIKARDERVKLKKDVASRKGTLESAKNGQDCRILHAFNVRTKRSRIEGELPHNLDEFDEQTRPTKRQRPNIRTVTLLDRSKGVAASSLLDNDNWFKYLIQLFDMSTMMQNVVVTEEMKKDADVLANVLRIRLKNHINNPNRVPDAKRNHWIWDWAEKNLPVCAAYMIAVGHVHPNFQSLSDEESLLSSDSNKFIPINRLPDRHGVYLNNDTKLQQTIRSGKKTSFGDKVEGFAARIEQHEKGCSASNPTSNFYKLYPSNSSGRSRNRSKQGVYEDLEHVIAVSYDPKGDAAEKVDLDWKSGGIMILNSDDVQRVKSSMKSKPYTDIEKFQLLLSYLFELAYDLAIAPGVNVSESPGFESFGLMNV